VNDVPPAPRTKRIRQLNDDFRSTFKGGRVMLTPAVISLPEAGRATIIERIKTFNDFNDVNAPYQEHDFIAFELAGSHIFVKIDYYAPDLQHGSEDPADPVKTTRVMTIMTAEEY